MFVLCFFRFFWLGKLVTLRGFFGVILGYFLFFGLLLMAFGGILFFCFWKTTEEAKEQDELC